MTAPPVRFDENGLIPAIIQDADSGEVLMMAYMNADALERTRETGMTHFWSRSRKKLWKKGETSGHVQLVKSIAVNCYENCLLVRVEQIGACCHTGYPTCFYRELDAGGELVTVRERSFDPADVYSGHADLEHVVRRWVGAYRWLSDHDLHAASRTSRHLRQGILGELGGRVADELAELAGVLSGEHSHQIPEQDIVLEGSQVLYWALITAMRAGLSDQHITAAITSSSAAASHHLTEDLDAEAPRWNAIRPDEINVRLPTVVGLVAEAAKSLGVDLVQVISHDLAELRERPYLAEYFLQASGAEPPDS